MILYALHDYDEDLRAKFGSFITQTPDVHNKKGYGIHFTPNPVNGKRIKENVIAVKYWFADFDSGDKKEQINKINKLLFKPSIIIDSRRGYHLYWRAVNATVDNFKTICAGIAKKLGTDPLITTPERLMRYPGYYNMKDKDKPFQVKLVSRNQEQYTEKEMLYAYAVKEKPKNKTYGVYKTENTAEMLNPDNWERIFFINKIVSGCRNNEFARITLWLKDSGFSANDIRAVIYGINQRIIEPLPDKEIESILRGKV